MSKVKKRKPDFRKIRPTKTYSVPEVAETLDRIPSTIHGWIRNGLPTLDTRKPPLINGSDLMAWLQAKWKARKHPCGIDQLYCCKCRQPRMPVNGSASIALRNDKTIWVKGRCSACGTPMRQVRSKAQTAELEKIFRKITPQLQHLDGCADAGVNRTPAPHRTTNSDATRKEGRGCSVADLRNVG